MGGHKIQSLRVRRTNQTDQDYHSIVQSSIPSVSNPVSAFVVGFRFGSAMVSDLSG